MPAWLQPYETLLVWLGLGSALVFAAGLALAPWLAVRLPGDYFSRGRDRGATLWAGRHPLLRMALLAGKNILGAVLLAAGLMMLVLPGPGLATILGGLVLLDFPGKYRFERWLVARGPVLASLNWLRRRAGRAELTLSPVSPPPPPAP